MLNFLHNLTSTGFIYDSNTKTVLLLTTSTCFMYDKTAKVVQKGISYHYTSDFSSFTVSRLFFDTIADNYTNLEDCFSKVISSLFTDYKKYIIYLGTFNKS